MESSRSCGLSITMLFCIVFLVLLSTFLSGKQTSKPVTLYRHNKWTADHGLPMNSVICLTQTPDGYLWLGTGSGLVRFDGVRFEVFDRENTPGFTCDLILCMLVDRDGKLWLGTRGGGVIRQYDGGFKAVTAEDGLHCNEIWALAESGDGTVWAGTRRGLNRISTSQMPSPAKPAQGRGVDLPAMKISSVDLTESTLCPFVRTLMEDHLGRIWVGTRGGGLVLVQKRGNRFETEFKGLVGEKISNIYQDRGGAIWVGTLDKGLIKLDNSKITRYDISNGLSCNNIDHIMEDRAGNLWIGTYGGGINVLDSSRREFSVIDFHRDLGSNAVYYLFEDREGIVWAGTDGGGLNCLRDTRIITYSAKTGLANDIANGVFGDSRGNTWIGSRGFGVSRGYKKDGRYRFQVLTRRDGLSSNAILSFAESPSGFVWMGTVGCGIDRFDLDTGAITHFDTDEGLTDNFVRALYAEPDGQLWAGADNGGIHRFTNGRFTLVTNVNYRVNCLYRDKNGTLWAGTFGGGAVRVEQPDGLKSSTPPELEKRIIMCIHQSHQGPLWFGTSYNGLYAYDGIKISHLTKKNGLPEHMVHSILEDGKHNLWMSTNRGIFCLFHNDIQAFLDGKIDRVHPVVYGADDGMLGVECNGGHQPAGWRTADGKMWFPTTRGVSVIDPEHLGINPLPPPVILEKITVDGVVYNPTNPVTAPPGEGKLEIRFTAPSFVVPKKIRIKYMMEGFDKEMRDAGPDRIAVYDHVPPGTYSFSVTACNSDGVWNNTGASVTLTIEPRFYQTAVFHIGLWVVVIPLLAGIFMWSRKYLVFRLPSKKYKASSLKPSDGDTYLRKILHLVKVEKIYRDPGVSLKLLATKLAISPRTISQVINERLKKSFFELINEHRIEEARDLLAHPTSHEKTILEIGFDVGFNSKSAFNRVFKNITNMTPSQYKKEKRRPVNVK